MSVKIEQYPDQRNSRRDRMLEPDFVWQIIELHRLGLGSRHIARELGINRNTVKRYLKSGDCIPYRRPKRSHRLDGLGVWLREEFVRHKGNCDVVRQLLKDDHGMIVGLRTVQRACKPFRAELQAQAVATVRFETPPGRQLQIDFGETHVVIDGCKTKVYIFVATLGYSRRGYVAAFRHQRQASWFAGLEGAFLHFGGVPQEVLMDNPKPLVTSHNIQTREVVFNSAFHSFARHWGFTPRACAPRRARTKGKDENGVGYVKKNALAGRTFTSWEAFEAHLARWLREVSDERIHGTKGEQPRLRFERDERAALKPLAGRPAFSPVRELIRVVNTEACIEVKTNKYSVPWRLIGEKMTVLVDATTVTIRHAGQEIASHARLSGSRKRSIDSAHFKGLVVRADPSHPGDAPDTPPARPETEELTRSLSTYEAAIGGGF